jgi:hypothetical protein
MTTNQKSTMNSCRFIVLTLATCMLAACIGCAHTVKFSYDPGVAPAPTLPCPVALSLSKAFTSYEHATSLTFTTDEVHAPFGPALQKYATYVAQSVFGDVQVLDGQPPRSEAKLLLIPRVTSLDLRQITPGSHRTASGALGVQWDFNNPKTGQTLFSMPVQCESTHRAGFFGSKGPQKTLAPVAVALMTNLTSITIQRFNASKDIQRLTGH